MRKLNWIELKAEWASTDPESLTVFARRKKLALSSVTKHARAEDWNRAREEFSREVAAKATALKVKFKAREEAEIDHRMHVLSDDITEAIRRRIAADKEPEKAVVVSKGQKPPKSKKLTALDLKLLIEAGAKAYEQQRMTIRLPARPIPEKIDISVDGNVGVSVMTGVVELPALRDD